MLCPFPKPNINLSDQKALYVCPDSPVAVNGVPASYLMLLRFSNLSMARIFSLLSIFVLSEGAVSINLNTTATIATIPPTFLSLGWGEYRDSLNVVPALDAHTWSQKWSKCSITLQTWQIRGTQRSRLRSLLRSYESAAFRAILCAFLTCNARVPF